MAKIKITYVKTLTVMQLQLLLNGLPDDAVVFVDGADCEAVSASTTKDGKQYITLHGERADVDALLADDLVWSSDSFSEDVDDPFVADASQ